MYNRLPTLNGTKKNITKHLLLLSLGLPSLDSLIGGGTPVGSLFLIEEDEYGIYSNVVLKHYLAEGVINNHALLLASLNINTKKMISELPSPLCDSTIVNDSSKRVENPLRVAWRYEKLPTSSSFCRNAVFGNSFDLNTKLDEDVLKKTRISYWDCEKYGNNNYEELYNFIKANIKKPEFSIDNIVENRTVLRVALISLGSPCWTGDICKFIMKLRSLIRQYSATCFITVAPNLFEDLKTLQRCEHFCDIVIQLKSLVNEGTVAYEDYDGLLIPKKLPCINSWTQIVPDSNDWAFKIKRKHFIIEKLHISPELKENVHREDEDVSKEYKTRKFVNSISEQF